MSFEETLEKFVRDIVAEQFENNDKLQERLAKIEQLKVSEKNLRIRLIGLEESVHNCVTRREARDVAYETVRDADLDELLGSYVKDKVEEVLDDDEFGDRMNRLITSILDETEFTVKVL